jgi:hypothetical protein
MVVMAAAAALATRQQWINKTALFLSFVAVVGPLSLTTAPALLTVSE